VSPVQVKRSAHTIPAAAEADERTGVVTSLLELILVLMLDLIESAVLATNVMPAPVTTGL